MRGTLANVCMKGRGVACRGYSANSSLQRPRPYNLVMKPVMTVRPALILEELFTGIADNVFRPYVTIGLQVTCASLCLPCFSCWALLSVVCLVHTGDCICEFLGLSPVPYPVAPVCLAVVVVVHVIYLPLLLFAHLLSVCSLLVSRCQVVLLALQQPWTGTPVKGPRIMLKLCIQVNCPCMHPIQAKFDGSSLDQQAWGTHLDT